MIDEQVPYVHPVLNRPCEAIGGHYVLTEEKRLTMDGGDVLVFLGYGVVDTSCCGPGGCRYALVPGLVGRYRYTRTPDGAWVSDVVPLRDPRLREHIRKHLENAESVMQVQFM